MKPTLAPKKILHYSKLVVLISMHAMYVFCPWDEVRIFSPVCLYAG